LEIKNQKLKIKNQKSISPEIRYLNDMKMVLYDRAWAKKSANFPVYYMYRGVEKKGKLRYDITEITSQMLGEEFPKTKGHEHLIGCSELVIVLEGEAIFFFQKSEGKLVQDAYIISAKKNQAIIVPPQYAHITINPSKRKLKIANWINESCQGLYDFIEKKRGVCYFYTKRGWIKNKNYDIVPSLRFEKPLNPVRKTEILKTLEVLKFSSRVKSFPQSLNFLKK